MNTTIHKSFPFYLSQSKAIPINHVSNHQSSSCNNFTKRDREFLNHILLLFNENYSRPNYHRFQLASDMALSEKQLQRKLKALITKNPMQYLKEFRLEKAMIKLKEGYRISMVGFDCGFSSPSYFSFCFKEHFGISPKIFQKIFCLY